MVVLTCNNYSFYMDGYLSQELDVVRSKVEKDDDRVFIVDGGEGSGKSVLAMQLAGKVDPSFDLSRVCFTPEDFIKAIKDAKPYQAVVFDEAFTGLSSRASLSKINNLVVGLMMEMRQKNLFVFIVMPSIFFLERYAVLFRCNGLFHVYRKGGKRGYWGFFKKESVKWLYLLGKKTFDYEGKGIPRYNFKGRFNNQYVVDEVEYRSLKKSNLESKIFKTKSVEADSVRSDSLFWALVDEAGFSSRELAAFLPKYGLKLSYGSVAAAVRRAKKRFYKDDEEVEG